MKRYEQNRIYISTEAQARIREFRVLIVGMGMGSSIAETMLRMGFERITLVDTAIVEAQLLSYENFTMVDVGIPKVEALRTRLLSINPDATIVVHAEKLCEEGISMLVHKNDVIINCLPLSDEYTLVWDSIATEQGLYVLHPCNIGFAVAVMVIKPGGTSLTNVCSVREMRSLGDLTAVKYITDYFNYWVRPKLWIEQVMAKCRKEKAPRILPQMSLAAAYAAGICTSVVYRIVQGEYVKSFPKFYYYSECDDLD